MTDRIPAERAIVLWDDAISSGGGSAVTELHVFDYHAQPSWARRLPASRGACDAGWMKGQWHETPLGLFTEIAVVCGFASNEAKMQALRAFAGIEEQDWAVDLLRALGQPTDDGDEA